MSAMRIFATEPWVGRLGWTLIHFLWQGGIIAGCYAAVRTWRARTLGPNGRYLLACAALAAMAAAPIMTWVLRGEPIQESVAASSSAPLQAGRVEQARPLPLPLVDVNGVTAGPFLSWVVAFWFCGATAFSLRLLGGWVVAGRVRYRMVRPPSAEWQGAFDRLRVRVAVSRPVRLLVSGVVRAPAAIGWLRPIVLVPAGALTGFPPAQIEALLLHELAHIRRYDYLANLVQSAVEAIFFYHPAVWWISGHMRAERELCCDDIAVALTGNAVVYAHALAELDSARFAGTAVMAANGGSLAGRIARLLGQNSNSPRVFRGMGLAPAAILLAMGAWLVSAQPGVRPQFEAASVKPSFSDNVMNVRALPGRLTADASLQVLMQYAYSVQPNQLIGGPGWLQSERYRIDATTGGNADRSRIFLMLQSLLENRFQVKIHRETRELPVYTLAAARSGLKLPPAKEGGCVEAAADASPEWAGGRMPPPGAIDSSKARCGSAGLTLQSASARLRGGKVAMPELVRALSLLLGRSVIDTTGFTGEFDLQLDFVPDENTPAMPPPPPDAGLAGASIAQALQQQLGLRLESGKGPVEVIVVDRAERPAGN